VYLVFILPKKFLLSDSTTLTIGLEEQKVSSILHKRLLCYINLYSAYKALL
jgi:hypothetical protein